MLLLKLGLVISVLSAADVVSAFKSSGMLPKGFLSDCPNITVPIRHQDLINLALEVHGAGSSKRIRYNYFQSHLISKNPYMNWSRKTLIYVGGYFDTPDFIHARVLEAAYINLGYNVILLDELFFTVDGYPRVSRKVRTVAHHVAEMLAVIHSSGFLNTSSVEMIGISLGGQTMAFIAKEFYKLTGKKVGRLTGLDPAGPCFRNLGAEERLSANDGEFVDVIHTNIDVYGMAARMGHVDFYIKESQSSEINLKTILASIYTHLKAYLIWLIILTDPRANFVGFKCDSIRKTRIGQCYNYSGITNVIGLKIDKTKQGIFYLET